MHSQGHRQHWEAHWMAQLGSTMDVIRHEGNGADSSVQHPKTSADLQQASEDLVVRGVQAARAGAAASASAELGTAGGADLWQANPELPLGIRADWASAPAYLSALSRGTAAAQATRLHIDGLPMEAQRPGVQAEQVSQPMLTGPRRPLAASPQSFALWRDDDTVRFAMRTREPEKAREIIGVLRGWLRAAGLSLRDFWINGRNSHGS
jgi:hypothetical protein